MRVVTQASVSELGSDFDKSAETCLSWNILHMPNLFGPSLISHNDWLICNCAACVRGPVQINQDLNTASRDLHSPDWDVTRVFPGRFMTPPYTWVVATTDFEQPSCTGPEYNGYCSIRRVVYGGIRRFPWKKHHLRSRTSKGHSWVIRHCAGFITFPP